MLKPGTQMRDLDISMGNSTTKPSLAPASGDFRRNVHLVKHLLEFLVFFIKCHKTILDFKVRNDSLLRS